MRSSVSNIFEETWTEYNDSHSFQRHLKRISIRLGILPEGQIAAIVPVRQIILLDERETGTPVDTWRKRLIGLHLDNIDTEIEIEGTPISYLEKSPDQNKHYESALHIIFGSLFGFAGLVIPELSQKIGLAYASLVWILTTVFISLSMNLYIHYYRILTYDGSIQNPSYTTEYLNLREELRDRSSWFFAYKRRLNWFFDRFDRLIGDEPKDRKSFSIGSLNVCVGIALFYPAALIAASWVITGEFGRAQTALLLPHRMDILAREAGVLFIILQIACFFVLGFVESWAWRAVLFFIATIILGPLAFKFFGPMTFATSLILAARLSPNMGGISAFIFSLIFITILSFVGNLTTSPLIFAIYDILSFFVAILCTGSYMRAWEYMRKNHKRVNFFLVTILFITIISIIFIILVSRTKFAGTFLPLMLYFVFIPGMTATTDWISLSLTRFCLRPGEEGDLFTAVGFAMISIMSSLVMLPLLVIYLLIGTTIFYQLVQSNSNFNPEFADPRRLIYDIIYMPQLPSNWWMIGLLTFTIIPCIFSTTVASTAIVFAIRPISNLVLPFLPLSGGIPEYHRIWISFTLMIQRYIGIILGILLPLVMAVIFFHGIAPWIGALLKMLGSWIR